MRKMFPLILSMFMASASYGQEFGVKTGLNYSNIVPDDFGLEYGEYVLGFHLGAFGTFDLTGQL